MIDICTKNRHEKAISLLIGMHLNARVGHLGGNLSVIDILVCLFHQMDHSKDTLVLSKGHSAGALYTCLALNGDLEETELATFHQNGTRLAGHPSVNKLPNVPFATGSLGHGLSLAAGIALENKLSNNLGHIFVVVSDGELQEGSTLEALNFVAHRKLDNLTIIIDNNGWQGFGDIKSVMGMSAQKICGLIENLGFSYRQIDGHDLNCLYKELKPASSVNATKVIVAKTIKGKGLAKLEDTLGSHYLPIDETNILNLPI